MLFSNVELARFVNQVFEPVWESVRPVPLVQIDFGNGTKITRTLNGNIATYVCGSDGQVLDILPGIYRPAVYVDRLTQAQLLAGFANESPREFRQLRLQEYHKGQAEALKKNIPPDVLVRNIPGPISKAAIERPLKIALVSAARSGRTPQTQETTAQVQENPKLEAPEELANWKLLAEDTKINETLRRRQIHELLANQKLARPEDLTKWLYKEVLHADLSDPYLGLGSALFAHYPFKDDAH